LVVDRVCARGLHDEKRAEVTERSHTRLGVGKLEGQAQASPGASEAFR